MIRKSLVLFISIASLFSCEKKEESVGILKELINVRVSNKTNDYQPNETTIAINPTKPLNLVAGANRKYYYYSFDGGESWNQGKLSTPLGALCDPCIRFDANGHVYYAHLAQVEGEKIADRMVVQKSIHRGVGWNDGVGFEKNGKYHDREWMCIDKTNSQHRNSIYVTWVQYDELFTSDPQYKSTILSAHSNDGGETWTNATIISDVLGDCSDMDSSLQGAKPAVGPNGEVYVCWSGLNAIYFDKSIDGGNTFGMDRMVTDQVGGWDFSVSGVSRVDGCPSIACDISDSEFKGNLYILWSDIRNGDNNPDVFLKRSEDGGESWSEIINVNDDDSGRQQFFPSLTLDPVTGYLYVVFYDRRKTAGDATDVYLARSVDGGKTLQNFRISKDSFTPPGVFIGDYIDIAAYNGMIYPIWTTANTEERSVIVALIDDTDLEK